MKIVSYIIIAITLIGAGAFGYYEYVYIPAELERAKQQQIKLEEEAERLRKEEKEEAERQKMEEREKVLSNAANACVELNNTMVGASGPSERIKILKSYGFEPVKAEIVNSTMGKINDTYNELKRWDEYGCADYKDTKEAISCVNRKTPSCEEIYVKAYDGISIEGDLTSGYRDECKVAEKTQVCRALYEKLVELQRLMGN